MNGTLLFLALLVFPFEFAFPASDDLFQPGILRNADDAADFVRSRQRVKR